jgi:hypothetical protein
MAELDKRMDPQKEKSTSAGGKVAGGVSGNSAETRQHQEQKSEVGDRRRNADPDAPADAGKGRKTDPKAAR